MDDTTIPQERPATITVDEFAAQLGISRGLAYQAIHDGNVPHVRIGRRIIIPADAVERMLAAEPGRRSETGQRR